MDDGEKAPRALALEHLRARREEIIRIASAYGASNVHVFGSVARGESDEQGDVDLLVDIGDGAAGFAYFGLIEDLRTELEPLLGRRVDVLDRAALRSMRERVLSEAVPI